MTNQEWIALFAPMLAALVTAFVAVFAAVLSGLAGKASAWLTAHGHAQASLAVAAADAVIQPALMTGASTIAGKIANGTLDYTDKAAIQAEARREVGLVQSRVPEMLAIATPAVETLVASMLGKVEQQLVASPTPMAAQVAPTATNSITSAAATINEAKAALASLAPVV